VSFRSGDFEDLARAITEGVNRFDQLSVRARTAAVDAHEQYSIAALVDHIFASAPRQPTSDPALWLTRVVDLEAILESHVLALQHGMRSARAAMTKAHDAAVSEQGRADDLRDRNDQLTLALQAGELRNSDLAAAIDGATSTVKETKRELEAATRDLATLKRDYETATGDREAATRDLATLSRDHETATRDLEAATRDLEAAMRDLDAATRELNTLRLDQESTTRDLDAAHRQLTDVEIELGAASARELRANRKIENLSHSVEVLEGGFTNRAFAAMKRVIKP
jgi:chromosome segregation ATPase